MEIQEAFNKAYIGVLTQPRLSFIAGIGCVYDDGEGCRCGVGHCLDTTSIRRIKFAGKNAAPLAELVERQLVPRSFDRKFFYDLQAAHDGASDSKDAFMSRMRALALVYDLTVPEVSE